MNTRLTNLPVPFTFQFDVAAAGTPEQLKAKQIAATIAFVDNSPDAPTITDSGSGFEQAGFQVGDQLTVSGSASNDGTYVIGSIVAGTITLLARESLTTEGAGATVTLSAPKSVPDGVSVTIKAKYANTGTIHLARSSDSALNSGVGSYSLRNNESFGTQVDNTDRLWLDASVSGEGVEVMFERALPPQL